MLELIFGLGNINDIDELEQLYNDLNDHLENGINYPGWKKGVYPVRQNAIDGVEQGCLHVARHHGRIVGSVILSHEPEPAYHSAKWRIEVDDSQVLVIYTFVVHPNYLKHGVGKALLEYCIDVATRTSNRSIRLDVFEKNTPAIRLYESCGFCYVDTVDLGLGGYGLDWFKLYERLLS